MITQRAQLLFSVLDSSDSIGHMSFWLADGVDLAAAAAAADTIRGLAAACMDCVFVRQSVVFSSVVAPRPSTPTSADHTQVGVLIFSTTGDEYAIIGIDGLSPATLLTTGPGAGVLIDVTNAGIAALVAALISGDWCNPFGDQLVALESAYLQIRR